MSTTTTTTREPNEFLDFESVNPSAPNTIILLHGASSSGIDWDLVAPYLPTYHLLMPSIFTAHSIALARKHSLTSFPSISSSSLSPTDWQPAYIHLLAALIKARAKNGRAHIVGLSMGASLAIGFATSHPDLILSVLVTGLPVVKERPSSLRYSLVHAGLLTVNKIQDIVSPATAQWLLDGEVALHPGKWDGKGQQVTSELMKICMDICIGCNPRPIRRREDEGADEKGDVAVKPLRIFILAATRMKWWMPAGDSVEWMVEVAKRLSGVSSGDGGVDDDKTSLQKDSALGTCLMQVKALEAKRMFHPWARQAPDVFAQCILAAAEGSPLPTPDIIEVWSHSTYE